MHEVEVASSGQVKPIAWIRGEAYCELPLDLYIPPDALEVVLEAFEGPLDLLLYLIRRHNLDILDIPIVEVTRQYIQYIELMKTFRLELAAEYMVMSATLAEIKSRLLLPRQNEEEEEGEDPRAQLVRRLQEYERFKIAAEDLDQLPRVGRDTFTTKAEPPANMEIYKPLPDVELKELVLAMRDVLRRATLLSSHQIQMETLSVRERMSTILERISKEKFVEFTQLFTYKEGRVGVVVSFIAILELLKLGQLQVVQNEPFSPIHIKAIEHERVESAVSENC